MARFLFIALVVANLGYFVWARGDADGAARGDREPHRLTQQVRPQLLQIREPGAPAAAAAPAPTADSDAAR